MARDLDLTETALREWVKNAEVDAGNGPPGALTSTEREELTRLRRENKRLQMEALHQVVWARDGGGMSEGDGETRGFHLRSERQRIRDGRRAAPGVARGFLHQPSPPAVPCARPVC